MKTRLTFLFFLFGLFLSAQVKVAEWTKNATIYEVNIRQFTPEGTFAAFQAHLPRLKEMGVDIIWLMPIHPIGVLNRKGSLGSYYAVRDYKGINPEFGTIDEFRILVKEAHRQGFKLIIDWVANHSSPDNNWVLQGHKDWYTLDSLGNLQPTIGTDWWDVADLNYDNNEMRIAMIDAMKYWVQETDIDGFRCDVAASVPMDFWNECRNQLEKVKPVFMLAEAEGPELHSAFDMTYAWECHHIYNDIAKGNKSSFAIRKYVEDEKAYPLGAIRMQFTSNHDENSWNGTEKERMGDARFALAVLSATLQGMPLIYNGQEASLDKRLRFFEKDTIDWSQMNMVSFYSKLMKLHQSNEALWNAPFGGDAQFISDGNDPNVLAFIRMKNDHKVLCVFNLANVKSTITLNGGQIPGTYTELFSSKRKKLKDGTKIKLGPWEYRVFHL